MYILGFKKSRDDLIYSSFGMIFEFGKLAIVV